MIHHIPCLQSHDICVSVVNVLWGVAADVNDVANRRLRGCACQCLYQLEEFVPVRFHFLIISIKC